MLIWKCFQLDELRRNMEIERDCVTTTYAMLQETIQKQYEFLVKDLERWESFQARITRLLRPSNDQISLNYVILLTRYRLIASF